MIAGDSERIRGLRLRSATYLSMHPFDVTCISNESTKSHIAARKWHFIRSRIRFHFRNGPLCSRIDCKAL